MCYMLVGIFKITLFYYYLTWNILQTKQGSTTFGRMKCHALKVGVARTKVKLDLIGI